MYLLFLSNKNNCTNLLIMMMVNKDGYKIGDLAIDFQTILFGRSYETCI